MRSCLRSSVLTAASSHCPGLPRVALHLLPCACVYSNRRLTNGLAGARQPRGTQRDVTGARLFRAGAGRASHGPCQREKAERLNLVVRHYLHFLLCTAGVPAFSTSAICPCGPAALVTICTAASSNCPGPPQMALHLLPCACFFLRLAHNERFSRRARHLVQPRATRKGWRGMRASAARASPGGHSG